MLMFCSLRETYVSNTRLLLLIGYLFLSSFFFSSSFLCCSGRFTLLKVRLQGLHQCQCGQQLFKCLMMCGASHSDDSEMLWALNVRMRGEKSCGLGVALSKSQLE